MADISGISGRITRLLIGDEQVDVDVWAIVGSGNWVALGSVEADSATMVFPLPMEGIEGITDYEAASYKVVSGDLSATSICS